MEPKSTPPIILAVVVVGAVALGAIVRAQTDKKPAVRSRVEVAKASQESDVVATLVATTERKPLSYYTGGVRGDLFTVPLPPVAKAPAKKAVAKKPELPPVPVVPNPFADYTYTGTINMGGQLIALVENVKTKEGQYLKVGDSFIGGSVSQIDDRTLTIDVAGAPNRLAKTDNYKLTPLDKDAENVPGAAAAGPPGAPAAAPPGAPAPGMPGAPSPGGPSTAAAVRRAVKLNSLPAIQRQKAMIDGMAVPAVNMGK